MNGEDLRSEAEALKKEIGMIMSDTTTMASVVVLLKISESLKEITNTLNVISTKLDKPVEKVIETPKTPIKK